MGMLNTIFTQCPTFLLSFTAAGLDFPDLGIVDAMNQQSDLSAPPLPPISQSQQTQHPYQAEQTRQRKPSVDMDDNNDFFFTGGRDRAMSFEFFSFGLNADEPLPPAPELSGQEYFYSGSRPRGDSIIFDPVSFRDGGVLEEGSLLKSRTNSIDIGTEEMAIMNTPGFVPAPVK